MISKKRSLLSIYNSSQMRHKCRKQQKRHMCLFSDDNPYQANLPPAVQ